MPEFSFRTRQGALRRFREETFDLLIIGGGITGAGVARDAASRGLKVALVEKNDFAWGTSSRSSKLIHGGLRYLQSAEFGLVFEALSERAHLLKTAPHMVRPLEFYLPVFKGDRPGKMVLSVGLWLYDLLALFRAPGFHRRLSRKRFQSKIPFIREEGLLGGFHYYDASMWDDVLVLETLRAASVLGAAIANYVEATQPVWKDQRIVGFQVRDLEGGEGLINLKAKKVVVCAGPWTDVVGMKLSPRWKRWLSPSKGVHLIFDQKRIPVPGAMVMTNREDGRISFVIPRPDFGSGVVIVGTTDGPTPLEPEGAAVESTDVAYLMDLLHKYFPSLKLSKDDIVSAYVGVRPLMGAQSSPGGGEGQPDSRTSAEELQKVSREHFIGSGPGGTVLVAGGKYTTHRLMAQEIVDFALKKWRLEAARGEIDPLPSGIGPSRTGLPVNPEATAKAVEEGRREAKQRGWEIPETLWGRYGAEAFRIAEIEHSRKSSGGDLDGFPYLASQLRFSIANEMTLHLEDFFLRRVCLFLARRDHGLPAAKALAHVWAEEKGLSEEEARGEMERLKEEFVQREAWRGKLDK